MNTKGGKNHEKPVFFHNSNSDDLSVLQVTTRHYIKPYDIGKSVVR